MKIATISDIHGMWLPLVDAPNVIPNFDLNKISQIQGNLGKHLTMYSSDDISMRLAPKLEYPQADVLLFAGDILSNYSRNIQADASAQLGELMLLNRYARYLKDTGVYKYVIIVAGNHDWCFERFNRDARNCLTNAIYLQDEEIVIDSIKFYGSPYQPFFGNWAYNFPSDSEQYRRIAQLTWGAISDDTNVLITHGPPREILDSTVEDIQVGCRYLADRVQQLPKLKLHVFGHIHHSYGKIMKTMPAGNMAMFVNTSICDNEYAPSRKLPVINI